MNEAENIVLYTQETEHQIEALRIDGKSIEELLSETVEAIKAKQTLGDEEHNRDFIPDYGILDALEERLKA